MTSVLLIYPFFRRRLDRSRFRFPPLGVAYVAAALQEAGHEVRVLDCTFLRRDEAARLALAARADVVGVYCMTTMEEDARWFAEHLRGDAIGAWDAVTAASARFVSTAHGVAFFLAQVKGAKLRRGRELIGARLAWSGFGYSLPPTPGAFIYEVRIERLP